MIHIAKKLSNSHIVDNRFNVLPSKKELNKLELLAAMVSRSPRMVELMTDALTEVLKDGTSTLSADVISALLLRFEMDVETHFPDIYFPRGTHLRALVSSERISFNDVIWI